MYGDRLESAIRVINSHIRNNGGTLYLWGSNNEEGDHTIIVSKDNKLKFTLMSEIQITKND